MSSHCCWVYITVTTVSTHPEQGIPECRWVRICQVSSSLGLELHPQLHNHFKISLCFWPHFVLWFIFLGPWFPCLQKTPKHVKLWQQIASVYCSLNISHFDSFNWAAGQRKCMFPNRGFSTWAEFLILVSLLTCCRGEGRAKHFATKTGKYENAARYSRHVHLYLYVHIYIFIQF